MTRIRKRQFVMRPVVSTLISHCGWFSVGLLVVRFRKSGDVWCYRVVGNPRWLPQHDSAVQNVWKSFIRAKSKGKWYNRNVRGKLEGMKLEGRAKDEVMGHIQGATKIVQ